MRFRWTRAWLRTSKPTEWITSFGVVGTIIAGILYFSTGILDVRKSELTMQVLKLEMDRKELIVQEKLQNDRITANNQKLQEIEIALSAKTKERDAAIRERDAVIEEIDGVVNAVTTEKIGDFYDRLQRIKKKRALEKAAVAGR